MKNNHFIQVENEKEFKNHLTHLIWLNKISAVKEIDKKTILGIHLAKSNLWEGADSYVYTFTAIENPMSS